MQPGGLPSVPDPTKIAGAGADVAKAIVQGGAAVGFDIADGIRKVVVLTTEGSVTEVDRVVRGVINIAKSDIEAGRATAEAIRRDIDTALNSALSQVDQVIGGEIVRKFKAEVEKQLR